jgi:short-subunit dehydrogenase
VGANAILPKDKTIYMNRLMVVTGGSKGIGRAIIERFAKAGFDIATCSRKRDDLVELKGSMEKTFPIEVHIYQADVTDKNQVNSFTRFINNLNRPIDVLVNNAGYFEPGKITEEAEGILEKMIHSNLYSAYYTTRGLVGGMKERKQGHIFTICSIASIRAYPSGGSYAISKFAALGFSKVLREELKEYGIKVTAVLPGATRTSSWDESDLPDTRFMKPEDIAETIFSAYSLSSHSVVEEVIIRPQLGDI